MAADGQIKTIELLFPRRGLSNGKSAPKIEAFGYTGIDCANATKAFQECLGQTVDVENKPDMFVQEQAEEHLREDTGE